MQESWLKVARVPGLPSRRIMEWLAAVGDINGICALPAAELRRGGLSEQQVQALKQPDGELLEADARWLDHPNHHLLTVSDPDYPSLLKKIPVPPLMLWVTGDIGALWQPQLAMVGSRNPTAGGRELARDFSATLVRDGWTITSGLAAGIDIGAHEAALDAGGQTIAVLGTGPDIVYPSAHAAAAERICAAGALVSEFPPGTPPKKQNFPERNRIISGLSLGVLVVEAALNSGSLITARLAAEQGREVFALPGSLHNPMAKGCHRLIKQGARLVEATSEITAELGPMARELALDLATRLDKEEESEEAAKEPTKAPGLLSDPDYQALWEALGHDPVTPDQLVERSGFSAREVSSMLLMMELQGFTRPANGGRVVRVPGTTERT